MNEVGQFKVKEIKNRRPSWELRVQIFSGNYGKQEVSYKACLRHPTRIFHRIGMEEF